MKQRLTRGFFVCLALLQLAVPASMIINHELALEYGRQYRFRTAPIDPADPFRGRFVALSFPDETVPRPDKMTLTSGRQVYASITEDTAGFAHLTAVSLTRPEGDAAIRVEVGYVTEDAVHLRLPFDRYYTAEHIAPEAERAYQQHSRRVNPEAYVTVRVRKGQAVLEELYIAGLPLREFLDKELMPEK